MTGHVKWLLNGLNVIKNFTKLHRHKEMQKHEKLWMRDLVTNVNKIADAAFKSWGSGFAMYVTTKPGAFEWNLKHFLYKLTASWTSLAFT